MISTVAGISSLKQVGETNTQTNQLMIQHTKGFSAEKSRKMKTENTPGTAGGPGGCDRALAVKS